MIRAARRILESCYQQAPDATLEELEHFVRLQASRVRKSKRVENPIGLLSAQIPKCFEGESFRQFREAEKRKREKGREAQLAAEASRQEHVAELRARLDDPNTGPEERTLIARLFERRATCPGPPKPQYNSLTVVFWFLATRTLQCLNDDFRLCSNALLG
jgi:hypothetical protein